MTFAAWKAYWKKMDWTKKWFAIFVLLRPLVDNFHYIKDYTSFLSPLYIVGVLTPVLIIMSLQSGKLMKVIRNQADDYMRVWGIAIFLNCMFLLLHHFSIDNFGDTIKYITPVLLFVYLRHFIQSKEDVHFILQTFLYSSIFPLGMMLYETAFGPINATQLSEGRGGGSRIRGEYGDSMSYAVYFIGAFLCYGYFFLVKIFNPKTDSKVSALRLLLVFGLCLFGVINIRHVATWSVFITLVMLLMYFNAKNAKGFAVVMFLGLIILPFFARSIYEYQIRPLIEKEFSVLTGEKDIEYSFNGRMSRWEKYFAIWEDMPAYSHYFGVSFSGYKESVPMMGGGMHNDYVRLLFLSGIFGLILYLLFLLTIFFRRNNFKPPERFLIIGSWAVIVLYSVSTLPTLYLALMNFIFPVFCFALLPRKKAYQSEMNGNLPNGALQRNVV